jgi:hypothetical protein
MSLLASTRMTLLNQTRYSRVDNYAHAGPGLELGL